MTRELKFITCQPTDINYVWQVEVQLHNFREYNISSKTEVLLYTNCNNKVVPHLEKWQALEREFPEVKFFYYQGDMALLEDSVKIQYAPLCRIWMLEKHFTAYSELENDAIFYLDCDVLFTKPLDWLAELKDDDINYLSYTGKRYKRGNYINVEYLDVKYEDVIPEKLAEFLAGKPVDTILNRCGVSREVAEANNKNSGGAQYLLKNINSNFWKEDYKLCMEIRAYFMVLNQVYFPGDTAKEKELKGFQSWCADMWSLLWLLWGQNKETKCPESMDFSWNTDPYALVKEFNIYHNAGVTSEMHKVDGVYTIMFNKNKDSYMQGISTPFNEKHYLSEVDPKFGGKWYTEQILKINK